ncbi:HxlR family transcriptional regulator [Enterobacter sp. BIGb0383]|uniref:winged helix-turn-helix transcriptional regulator n=1 Tax=unclassified Enterobacter TaxID=2608935 RepID=UPI000F4966D1|nr:MULTISPECIES: helix-turn-helix domain-containing protein [unclassified Enterobacter]ROP58261.1 HxlR family transcriptional regulator [Enterobacter sp. BIGb0383]ROS06851.1 HxlR family transcriptional regulator [Enterobacter sp. BIGb0359]
MKNEALLNAPCPIARSLGRMGDGWTLMILRDAFAGLTRFDEFQRSCNVAPNILSRRLKEMVKDGLLVRVSYSSAPPRHEYRLTDKSRELHPIMLMLTEWGNRHCVNGQPPMLPVDTASGRPITAVVVDKETGQPLTIDRYEIVPGPGAGARLRYRHDYIHQKRAGQMPARFLPPEAD